MKLMISLWITAGVFVFSGTSLAQHNVGNGGNAVVCYQTAAERGDSTKITSVQLFDYWEMSQLYPVQGGVEMGGPASSVPDLIRIAMKRLHRLDPVKADELLEDAMLIADHINYYLADRIGNVNDDRSRLNPSSPCFKEQYAIQIKNPKPGEKRFLVNRNLYQSPQTSNMNRAGIILHEVIYRDAIKSFHHVTSDGSRMLNYYLGTRFIETASTDQYEKILTTAGFPSQLVKVFLKDLDVEAYVLKDTFNSRNCGRKEACSEYVLQRPAKIGRNNYGLSGEFGALSLLHYHGNQTLYYAKLKNEGTFFEVGNGQRFQVQQLENYTYLTNGGFSVNFFNEKEQVSFGAKSFQCSRIYTSASFTLQHCGLSGSAPVSFLLPSGRNVTLNSNAKKMYISLELSPFGEVKGFSQGSEAEADQDTAFLVSGTKWTVKPYAARFSSSGELIEGYRHGSDEFHWQGGKLRTQKSYQFNAIGAGRVLLKSGEGLVWSKAAPRLRGRPVMVSGELTETLIERYCEEISNEAGADGRVNGPLRTEMAQTKKVNVVGSGDFYELNTGKLKTVVDDKVNVLDQVNCRYRELALEL